MKTINKITLSLVLISSLVNAGEIGIDSLGINVGKACIDAKQSDKIGSVVLNKSPEEKYTHFEAYTLLGGIVDDKSWKPSINVTYNTNDDFKNYLLMVGLNKHFEYDSFNLYAGALVGVGKLSWQYNPLNSTMIQNYKSYSPVGAIQVGAEYKITEKLLVGLNAKYYIHEYGTSLKATSDTLTEITHSYGNSVSIGLRFKFE